VVGQKTSGGATVLAEKWVDARTVDLTFDAPMVWPAPLNVRIILPVGFDANQATTYPVVFEIHGGNDNYTSWDRNTDLRAIPYKAIFVLPDGGPAATYTNYLNTYNGWKEQWMQFHTKEVPQILTSFFRANKNWAIQGISSGGYGSFAYASQNPGMFKFAASYSGPIAIKLPVLRSLLMVSNGDLDPYARWGVPILDEKNWDAKDPLTSAAGLRGTQLYISSGTTGFPNPDVQDGPYGVQQIGEFFAGVIGHAYQDRLKQLNIPATFSFYELGEHNWNSWKREILVAQPTMMKAIGAQHT
jgi:S-formylglutathione hydrolase FrmB